MDGLQQEHSAEDVIEIGEYFAVLRKVWWKAFLLSLAVGVVTLLLMLQMRNIYQATAVITPATEEGKQNPTLGALASFGIIVGGPAKVEDLETLFKSNDLTVRVFRKYNLWPIVLGDGYDPATGKMKISWIGRVFGEEKTPKPPGDWDAIRAAKRSLKVSVNRRSGTLAVSFETPSAESSANIVKYYLEEGKSRLQEEALERASNNKKFIGEQISRTVDPLTRDRLYSLFGQEVEREMLARNREQFGFGVVDSPRVPDRKSKPHRGLAAILVFALSFFAGCIFFAARGRPGRQVIHAPTQAKDS